MFRVGGAGWSVLRDYLSAPERPSDRNSCVTQLECRGQRAGDRRERRNMEHGSREPEKREEMSLPEAVQECCSTYALVLGMLARVQSFPALVTTQTLRMPVEAQRLRPLSCTTRMRSNLHNFEINWQKLLGAPPLRPTHRNTLASGICCTSTCLSARI